MDPFNFGKAVGRMANQWHAAGYPDADERRAIYLQERQEAYDRICEAYRAQGQEPPEPKILSGED